MQIDNNRNRTTAFILTLIFPFGGLIYTLNHWRESWAKNTFWLACIYLGAVLIYWPEGTVLGTGFDGGVYALRLIEMHGSAQSLSGILTDYFKEGSTLDLYQPLVTYLISRFTDNGHVLFAVFASVFGFFYSRNIWYVLEKFPNRKLGIIFILVSLYFLICPITQINGVRMWTALHVFVYGMMPYLWERDRTKIWWVILAPLFHFSFLYISIFALLFILLPYRLKTSNRLFLITAFMLLIVTLFVNGLNLSDTNDFLKEYSPEAFENRIDGYVNQSAMDANLSNMEMNNWYVNLAKNVTHWVYNILLLLLLPCLNRRFKGCNNYLHLYVFSLLISSFANVSALLPSGARFQFLSQMFKVPIILLVVLNIPPKDFFRKCVNISSVILLLPLLFEFRKLFDFIGITAIFGNFFTVFLWESNVPLIQFIKQIL